MTDLGADKHSLNNSSSKMKYSFPKTSRFPDKLNKSLCDSYYELPSTKTQRGTSLGLGNKVMGVQSKVQVPGPGTYQIDPEGYDSHKMMGKKGVTFGESRDRMDLGGPLGNVMKVYKNIPGPGQYKYKDVQDKRGPGLKSRLPDLSTKNNAKNPGPGAYSLASMAESNFYINSRYKKQGSARFSQLSRTEQIKKLTPIGPGDYEARECLGEGKQLLSKHGSARGGMFSKSQRPGPVEREKSLTPGPGLYKSISEFGL